MSDEADAPKTISVGEIVEGNFNTLIQIVRTMPTRLDDPYGWERDHVLDNLVLAMNSMRRYVSSSTRMTAEPSRRSDA